MTDQQTLAAIGLLLGFIALLIIISGLKRQVATWKKNYSILERYIIITIGVINLMAQEELQRDADGLPILPAWSVHRGKSINEVPLDYLNWLLGFIEDMDKPPHYIGMLYNEVEEYLKQVR